MYFKSIYLENFRVYKGPVKFELSTGDKKINVIQGNNDAGKTTMLNAITWCLYGEEVHYIEDKDGLGICNNKGQIAAIGFILYFL